MSRSERDNSLDGDDDLPPLHPLLQMNEPPPPESGSSAPDDALFQTVEPPQAVTPPREPASIEHEHQPEAQDPAEPHAVEAALVAASSHAARASAKPPPRSRRPRWVLPVVAIVNLIIIPLSWREAGRISAGGELLQQWVRERAIPLPDTVADPQQLDIRPRRAIRPGNFFGDGRYAYELWDRDPAGPRLVAKYLLVYAGGEYTLETAFDATTQQRMAVNNE